MSTRDPQELLEQIATLTILADATDKPALTELLKALKKYQKLISPIAAEQAASLVSEGIANVKAILSGAADDPQAALQSVSDHVTALQKVGSSPVLPVTSASRDGESGSAPAPQPASPAGPWTAPLAELDPLLKSASLSDKPGLARTMDCAEALAEALRAEHADEAAQAAKAARILRDVLLDDCQDSEASLAEASAVLLSVQSSILHDASPLSRTGEPEDAPAPAPSSPEAEGADWTLPEWVDEAMFRDFVAAQGMAFEEIEGMVLELEHGDPENIAALKRRIHTMKGESGVMGLDELSEVCHAVEDLIEADLPLASKTDRLLAAKDWMQAAVEAYGNMRRPSDPAEHILHLLAASAAETPPAEEKPAADRTSANAAAPSATADKTVQRDAETLTMLGDFLHESEEGLANADDILMNVESDGADSEKINSLFRVFHTIKGVAGFLELKDITELAHSTETMLNMVRQGTLDLRGAVLDLVFDATEMMRQMLAEIHRVVVESCAFAPNAGLPMLINRLQVVIEGKPVREEPLPIVEPGQKLGEVLVESGVVDEDDVTDALENQHESGRRLGEELVATGAAPAKQVAQALRAQSRADQNQGMKLKETVKVDLERVDSLVAMIGELVITESMVENATEVRDSESLKFRNHVNQLSKITRDLQSVGMLMRMVPVRGLFQKMARMVRDLSRKGGKDILMLQAGEATEMDRSMVEQISDPLVHMIRNAVDHGVGTNAERAAAGKKEKGTVKLSAYHEGGSIVIEISDNGRGIDKEKVLKKAVAQGLVKETDSVSEQDIYNLIFMPGFSTAEKVTEISGRGVGMDVVRRNIEAMRGRIITSSEKGKGTTFKLILPLTLAIIDGMLVSCGTERYIIPTLSIIESLRPDRQMISTLANEVELIDFRGEVLPLIRLDRLCEVQSAAQDITQALVVVIESFGRRFGLVVDDVLTQQQVVIKSIGTGMDRMKYVSGATILSDGLVGLILNTEEIASAIGSRDCLSRSAAVAPAPPEAVATRSQAAAAG
ncbi:MAG: chemotaxis protein CheA [Myxococcales bacterium]|nr:MAG: chemotaxis protein CheA [Myxococcales bacterium]